MVFGYGFKCHKCATKSGLRVRILCPDTVAIRTCAASTGDTASGHVIRISVRYSWYSRYS